MPLRHALMITMEHLTGETVLHYSAFAMGTVGMAMGIIGVFAKGDTRHTLWGLFGGLLFWTGLSTYFANRFDTQPLLDPVTGEVVTRPEYLIMPTSFAFWMMTMNYVPVQHEERLQLHQLVAAAAVSGTEGQHRRTPHDAPHQHRGFHGGCDDALDVRPAADVLLRRTLYRRPQLVTLLVGMGGFIGSLFMFAPPLRYPAWGMSLRYGYATVIIFWIGVEVFDRIHVLEGLWVTPLEHTDQLAVIGLSLLATAAYLIYNKLHKKQTAAA